MNEEDMSDPEKSPKIIVSQNGPYHLEGDIPIVQKTQLVSEYGEPLTWLKGEQIKAGKKPILCRCGKSETWPLCDFTHLDIEFDGTETVDKQTSQERRYDCPPGEGMVVRKDAYLCMESGFCGNRHTTIEEMMADTAEPSVRAEIMAMIDRCPSGAFTFALDDTGPDVEPDYPVEVASTTEITSDGPIRGPLWVTGNIPIELSDGSLLETRNRVTLCNCGKSQHKPLCDGTHRNSG
jgi:CDGSH-type Zn-finger protein